MKAEIFENEGDLMDHVCLEIMSAIESRDKRTFKQGFRAFLADLIEKMSKEMDEGDQE